MPEQATDEQIIEFVRFRDWAAGILPEPRTIEECRQVLRVEVGLALRSDDAVLEAYHRGLLEPDEADGATFEDYLERLHEGARMLGTTVREVLGSKEQNE